VSVTLSLDWIGDLSFKGSDGSPAIELHSSKPGFASPPQALAYATMACMAMDVVRRHRAQGRRTRDRPVEDEILLGLEHAAAGHRFSDEIRDSPSQRLGKSLPAFGP
jgi:hypothetical protein